MLCLIFFVFSFNVILCFTQTEEYLFSRPLHLKAKRSASEACQLQLDEYWRGITEGELWAWNMFDATSKIPSGFLTGNIMDLGNFDQCLSVDHTGEVSIRGKYCFPGMVTVFPMPVAISENSSLYVALNDSLQTKFGEIFRNNDIFWGSREETDSSSNYVTYYLSLCIPDQCLPSEMDLPLAAATVDDYCQTTGKEFEIGDYSGIAFFSIVVLLMVLSTFYDIYLEYTEHECHHPLLLAFSVKRSGQKLLEISDNPRHLTCFGGLRFLTCVWIILVHRYLYSGRFLYLNKITILSWMTRLYSMYVQAGLYGVDTFLVLGGCLISYSMLMPMKRLKSRMDNMKATNKLTTGVTATLMSWLTRYLRINPSLYALYILYITFLRHIGTGPTWNMILEEQRETCLNHWWSFLLHIENYVHTDNLCLSHTWYLHADLQLYILVSPILLWLLVYLPRTTFYLFIPILTVVAIIVTWLICYINEIAWLDSNFQTLYYYLTHTRVAPWFIGILLGIFLNEYKNKEIKIKKVVVCIVWIIIMAGFIALILCQKDPTIYYGRVKTSIWTALHKPAWAVCVCWVIFACVKGYGGIINTFLSLPVFQVLGKLTYGMYLVHVPVIVTNTVQSRVIWYISDYDMFYKFMADVVFTIIIATFWVLAFEIPMMTVEKFITGKGAIRKEKENLIKTMGEDAQIPNEDKEEIHKGLVFTKL